ncbi:hypothetical protein HOE22_06290 [Candidatus Woesearchaeota archaeon]|jgi:hypothetical protein|nr:hypothetical protein [Candidatus Woesearchaeota archaeon]MBT6128822.1 hypothetical protein [Candidatus Neomarinimicrobiota bacterium]MBT7556443.1 hypothetical protein [Candidatus Woesearchaeota archaeon]
MITELQGYKGSTRKYTAPVSESVFSGDQLQFYSNVSGSLKDGRQDKMPFTMNMRNARATDLHHVLHYKDTVRFIQRHRRELRYSDIETNASTYQTFNLGISAGFSATAMGTRVKVNGVNQINKTPWTNTSGVDWYFATNYRKIHIRKLYALSGVLRGITLQDGDEIQLEFQTEII